MTVKDYMDILAVSQSHKNEIDKDTECLSIFYKRPEEEFERISFKDRNKLIGLLKERLLILEKVKKRKYIITSMGVLKALDDVTDPNNCFAQYKDVKYLLENGGVEKNLHKLLACIYRPVNWRLQPKEYTVDNFVKVSGIMLNTKVSKVLGAVFFYSRAFRNSMILSEIYLEEMKKEIEEVTKEAKNYLYSLNNGDGITSPTNLQNLTG